MERRKDTTNLLKQLRSVMKEKKYFTEVLHAYLIPSGDTQRRAYVSGFTGSAGSAVITLENACVWTDGRYFLQATQEMDSNWTLMKEGLASTPTQGEWLISTLPSRSYIGVDPEVIGQSEWTRLKNQLDIYDHRLVAVETNLVDLIWTDRPPIVRNPIVPLELEYTGSTIANKLNEVYARMGRTNVKILMLTALDEIAWLLNLRGSDLGYTPVFRSFVMIVENSVTLFIHPQQTTPDLMAHFKVEAPGAVFDIRPYSAIACSVRQAIDAIQGGLVWFSNDAKYFITSLVPPKRLKMGATPCALLKTVKNSVEIHGMRNAHIKDAVAVCNYFAWLEEAVQEQVVTEISGAHKLTQLRSEQRDFVSLSFNTISAVGDHAAIIHYAPKPETDIPITMDALYLCDSGAQFKDGTTDITRTIHLGAPTEFERECFTRVLKGQLKLARAVFPKSLKGDHLDSFAREFLWERGLDYAHGTGHGVGSYLNVHEGPIGITSKPMPDDPGLVEGMILSNEPGYYQDGKFGVRIEDLVLVVSIPTPHANGEYLTFETLTLVPKQTKLINVDLLTDQEIRQINDFHKKCRDVIGPLLGPHAKSWLWKETQPLNPKLF
ncbi:hypothetical protein PPYR_09649 [Photinus pyralis]|uniref:Xaa-Pro aminopeptidase 1 n=3 Tax=Photinus pyralis TaxID=7054 RepID=A0A5N4AMX6_PHOPY|nr:xaa-Pro aminopeptidase 1-like [Photinus pyralis]XP_031343158.1 xaa-Pro aminopeptidase 1-like [Photinus pyralis]KAB0798656.1 hypothetical protein PPYR_09649 [Photinus pyralis]